MKGDKFMSLEMEAVKLAVRAAREKQVMDIRERCKIQGKEYMVPREGKEAVQVYLYYPAEAKEPMPVLVNIHGGAWVGGDALVLDTQSRELADALGCLVVNLNYKKADERPMPYCQEEARDTIEYFISHGADFQADGKRIAVMGYSAGAQISASAAQMVYDDGYKLSCQILCYPFVDFTYDGGKQTELAEVMKILGEGTAMFFEKAAKDDPKLSPALRSDFSGLSPAIIVSCGRDSLAVQARQYHELLCNAGVSSTLLAYPEAQHGFLEVNYPETVSEQEAKSPEQEAIMRKCEADIMEHLQKIWNAG